MSELQRWAAVASSTLQGPLSERGRSNLPPCKLALLLLIFICVAIAALLQTSYELAVVGADDKVQIRSVKAGDRLGMLWVIEDGLKPDDRVIVEGSQRVRDGQIVKPVPWTRPAGLLTPK
jgi:hypothetical protein